MRTTAAITLLGTVVNGDRINIQLVMLVGGEARHQNTPVVNTTAVASVKAKKALKKELAIG